MLFSKVFGEDDEKDILSLFEFSKIASLLYRTENIEESSDINVIYQHPTKYFHNIRGSTPVGYR